MQIWHLTLQTANVKVTFAGSSSWWTQTFAPCLLLSQTWTHVGDASQQSCDLNQREANPGSTPLARRKPDCFNFHMTEKLTFGYPITQPLTTAVTTRWVGLMVWLSCEEHTNLKGAKPAAFLSLGENTATYKKIISTQYSYSTEWGQKPHRRRRRPAPSSVEETFKETRLLCSDACNEIKMLCCASEIKLFPFVTETPAFI